MRGRLLCLVVRKIGFARLQLPFFLLHCVSKSISDPHICPVRSGVNPGGKRFTQTGHIRFCPQFRVTDLGGHLLMRVALRACCGLNVN